ncbi:MAG: hypothetical protein NC301_05370 [Bacteroides sp.]|nr:hypothetical protein [Bacteroides sp.]MCM1379753.1 hypothetical protein [Bacteroides sp.]MCM1445706.1 hypothetical protein [Prevotella sp.]
MKLLLQDGLNTRVIADSAIARNGLPWFLPEEGKNWHWRTAVAYRVSKLGKNVGEAYVERYIDAVTLLWIAEADDFTASDYMDGSVVCGKWLELQEPLPARSIAALTKNATIKNGDILAFACPEAAREIKINDHISLGLYQQEVLSFNIK